jgi:hypothetical protein
VAPKSKQPRRKTVFDEFGERHVIDVVRYYCLNPECAYHTFTHFPPGVVPHSRYPVPVRLLAVEVYDTLLTTYRRSARLFDVTAATLYHWVSALSPATECLAAYLGVVRTSGVSASMTNGSWCVPPQPCDRMASANAPCGAMPTSLSMSTVTISWALNLYPDTTMKRRLILWNSRPKESARASSSLISIPLMAASCRKSFPALFITSAFSMPCKMLRPN